MSFECTYYPGAPVPKECCDFNSGDIAWMLTSTALVMIQTPAIGIAQAGMIRRKNSLSMLMQTMSGFFLGSITWFILGFTLTFGPDAAGFIGNLRYAFFVDLGVYECLPDYSVTIPGILFAIFQMMFAIMVPVIITGAWAEKLNFKAFLIFTIVWPFLVYYPLAHWIWGSGGWLKQLGAIDFAGGVTIHTNSGVAALVVALMMRRRRFKKDLMDVHHNVPLTIVGGAFIIFGWYGFNGGSSFAADAIAVNAFLNSHIAMSTSAFMWGLIAFISDSHFHLSEIINGAFAGLATVTPGAGFVTSYSAFCMGIVGGIASYFSAWFLKDRVQLDDVLDVSSLQGVPGILGTFMTGLLSTVEVNKAFGVDGMFYGRPILVVYQLTAIGAAIFWSGFWTFCLFVAIDQTIGAHVSIDVQEAGLDTAEVGEEAYDSSEDEGGRKEKTYVTKEKGAGGFMSHPVDRRHR